MDKFEDVTKRMSSVSREERKKVNPEDRAMCSCPPCPTHLQCAKDRDEYRFCFEGKSGCLKEQKVCFCPDCPVHAKYDLGNMYYCLRGTEAEIRSKEK